MKEHKYKLIGNENVFRSNANVNNFLKVCLCCVLLAIMVFYKASTDEYDFSIFLNASTTEFLVENASLPVQSTMTMLVTPKSVITEKPRSVITKEPPILITEGPPRVTTKKPASVITNNPTSVITEDPPIITTKGPPRVITTNPTSVKTQTPTSVITVDPPILTTKGSPKETTKNATSVVTKKPTSVITKKPTSVITKKPSSVKTKKPPSKITKKPPPKQEFYVRTSQCRMIAIDPFTPEARKNFKPHKYVQCAKDKPLVTTIYDANTRRYLLHINTEIAASQYANVTAGGLSCCYRQVVRAGSGGNADKKYNLLPCANFHQDFVVPPHVDAAIVECSSLPAKKLLQQDAISFVQYRPKTRRPKDGTSANATHSEPPTLDPRKPSVLFIGIDSLSRSNFRRNMPLTFRYTQEQPWIEMQGYNKMGDNTFPNLMAVLTGHNETTAYAQCNPKVAGGLDKCTFMWHLYQQYGYRTAYAEDTCWMGTFNYLKKGFKQQPTDYYLRPMLLAIEKKLKVTKKEGLLYCIGRRQYGEYVYDYALQFAKQYHDEPLFGFFWTNSFSHNDYASASAMDGRMLAYFRDLEANGVLEKSIVIFFSDHGCRWGPLLDLPEGFMEERLPMLFIWLPKWFKNQYPELVRNLEVNRNRLTSPYDLYATLGHLLQLSEPGVQLAPSTGCPHCQSFFREVPENRTCEQAGISEHWCTCVTYKTVSTGNGLVKKVTQLIIDATNQYLAGRNLTSLCARLVLNKISSAQLKADEDGAPQRPTYRLKYSTKPSDARFQATAEYDAKTKSVSVVVEDISRLNVYAKDAKCIDDKEAKKYCICKGK